MNSLHNIYQLVSGKEVGIVGIGRREFLRICGQAYAAYCGLSTSAVDVVDDLYVNRKLGIAFRKPLDWSFTDIKQMGKIAEGQIMAAGELELTPEMQTWIGQPFVSLQQQSSQLKGFVPSAQFYLVEDIPEIVEVDSFMKEMLMLLKMSDKELMEMDEEQFGEPKEEQLTPMLTRVNEDIEACTELFNQFKIVNKPEEIVLSNSPGAAYTASYMYEHLELRNAVRIRVKTIFTQYQNLIYLIRFIDAPYQDSSQEFSFDSFEASVTFL